MREAVIQPWGVNAVKCKCTRAGQWWVAGIMDIVSSLSGLELPWKYLRFSNAPKTSRDAYPNLWFYWSGQSGQRNFPAFPIPCSTLRIVEYRLLKLRPYPTCQGFSFLATIPVFKTITWLLLSRLQGNKPHRNSPKPSEPCLQNPGTFQDLPEPTFQNLPEPASGTYTSTHRNSPEPSSGTFLRNLLLWPAPAHTGAYLGWRPH